MKYSEICLIFNPS